jgi:hypothetical protein
VGIPPERYGYLREEREWRSQTDGKRESLAGGQLFEVVMIWEMENPGIRDNENDVEEIARL